MRFARDTEGQASVEFVAVLPILAFILAVLIQAVLAGHAIWAAQWAAQAAARAEAIGLNAERAARSTLPLRLERELTVWTVGDGGVRLTVRIPALIGGNLGSITASARMEPQR